MQVRQAKERAHEWVSEVGSATPGFRGAFFHGSVNWLADEDEMPATSDLDVRLVLAGSPSDKLGKFPYRGVLLEVSYQPQDELESAEQVLGVSHLAGSLARPSVIADPTGWLTELHRDVARDYPKLSWVRKRTANVRAKSLSYLEGVKGSAPSDPFHEQVTGWLFAAGLLTHVLLVAGLRNPTVRKRYVAARELLREYGRADFSETLLEGMGCAHLTRERVREHLSALAEVFDVAGERLRTPVFYASDLSPAARPIAIDGSRELIDQGEHREAMFWIVATACRCQRVLELDGTPALRDRFAPAYGELVGDLGISSFADLLEGVAKVERLLPSVEQVAEGILAACPEIQVDS